MTEVAIVRHAARLRGEPRLPGDKSISHRALLLALLAEGDSRIHDAGDGEDVRTTADLVGRLGATVTRTTRPDGRVDYRVVSPGSEGIGEPDRVLDCRNSGTTLRLAAGILASRPLFAVLDGDDSLRRRPVARLAAPLTLMGATLAARGGGRFPPLAISGRTPLRAIDYATPVPSAQVKSAILLAALGAEGRTVVREAVATRDHTERMLRARGVPVSREGGSDGGGAGAAVSLEGGTRLRAVTERVPADISAAAFWLVAAASHPDACLTLKAVGTNATRRAIIDLLRRMGADIDEHSLGGSPGDDAGEPVADLTVRTSALTGIELGPADVAAAIDEIPILCLAAAVAAGRTLIRGAGELRHKESDRIAGIVAGLTALGVRATVDGDDIEIEGGRQLHGATTQSHDDHRLAMTFAVAGLIAGGETAVQGPDCAAISYPGFFAELERVRA